MDDGIAAAIGGQLLQGTVVSTGYFKDNPSKGNQQFVNAMTKKYGDKAQISGAAAAAWDGVFILAHALKNAKSTGGADVIAALMNAKTSGPRGDLAFKNRHYVALTTYVIQEQKDGSRSWSASSSGSRRSRSTRPASGCRAGRTHRVEAREPDPGHDRRDRDAGPRRHGPLPHLRAAPRDQPRAHGADGGRRVRGGELPRPRDPLLAERRARRARHRRRRRGDRAGGDPAALRAAARHDPRHLGALARARPGDRRDLRLDAAVPRPADGQRDRRSSARRTRPTG